jgi:hypothetical protein
MRGRSWYRTLSHSRISACAASRSRPSSAVAAPDRMRAGRRSDTMVDSAVRLYCERVRLRYRYSTGAGTGEVVGKG